MTERIGLAQDALGLVRNIPGPVFRCSALIDLLGQLEPSRLEVLLDEILALIQGLMDGEEKTALTERLVAEFAGLMAQLEAPMLDKTLQPLLILVAALPGREQKDGLLEKAFTVLMQAQRSDIVSRIERHLSDMHTRSWVLVLIASLSDASLRCRSAQQALDAISMLQNEKDRSALLVRVLPVLDDTLLRKAMEIALSTQDPTCRLDLVVELGSRMDESALLGLLRAERSINAVEYQANLLVRLGPRLSALGNPKLALENTVTASKLLKDRHDGLEAKRRNLETELQKLPSEAFSTKSAVALRAQIHMSRRNTMAYIVFATRSYRRWDARFRPLSSLPQRR